jgi:hypothetical protein
LRPHDVLQVTPAASRQEVTEAFRRFALRHHPDRGGDPATFQAGVEAYHRLTGAAPPARPRAEATGADVVFHRRTRPGPASLARLAGRRLASIRFRA